jgi:hypothetical protein
MARRIAVELDALLTDIEPGAVSRLADIATDRRWEIIFLTRNGTSNRATAQLDAQLWLESKGFALPSVFVAPGPRGAIAAALGLDLVVDVRPENCVSVVCDSDARAILVSANGRSSLPAEARRPEITLVKSFGECLDMLTARDEPTPQHAARFAWIRRLFGWKRSENLVTSHSSSNHEDRSLRE